MLEYALPPLCKLNHVQLNTGARMVYIQLEALLGSPGGWGGCD